MSRMSQISNKIVGLGAIIILLTIGACTKVEKYPDIPSTLNKKEEKVQKVIQPIGYPLDLKNAGKRSLKSFYSRRPSKAAPAFIPHSIDKEWKNSGDCLSCHKNGGYVMKWKKFTPPMPHDFMGECRMCHNPVPDGYKDAGLAAKNLPKLGNRISPFAPPQIPHSTGMRKNCVSCHFGPTAIKEVLSSHEERANCIVCHKPLAQ